MKAKNDSRSDFVGAIEELANALNLLASALLGGEQGQPIRDEVTKCTARAVKLANDCSASKEPSLPFETGRVFRDTGVHAKLRL